MTSTGDKRKRTAKAPTSRKRHKDSHTEVEMSPMLLLNNPGDPLVSMPTMGQPWSMPLSYKQVLQQTADDRFEAAKVGAFRGRARVRAARSRR